MDADRVYTFPDEQIDSDNDARNMSLTERELGLQLTIFSAAQSMDTSQGIILWMEHKRTFSSKF